MAGVEVRTVDQDEADMRLDRWFRAHFPGLSHGRLEKLLRTGQIRVDGKRVKANQRLESGQAVRIPPLTPPGGSAGNRTDERSGAEMAATTDAPTRPGRGPAGRALADADALRAMILHEDDDLLVLNKPHGLAVQGGSGLTKHVDGMLSALTDRGGRKPRLVHRLDRDTTGVLLVAKKRTVASALAAAFKGRETKKTYWALVKGVPKPRQGRISSYIARDEAPGAERMRIAAHGEKGADHAVSLYTVVDHVGQRLAWLAMRPVTGRTHQLRAHAAHMRHPIIGDPKYFDILNWDLPGGLQNRLHLHARRLEIPHPAGGVLDVSAPLPPHMVQSWHVLGFDPDRADDPFVDAPDE